MCDNFFIFLSPFLFWLRSLLWLYNTPFIM
nr:MAG TPA: hypothetical protein [Caudoviricetes sp.]